MGVKGMPVRNKMKLKDFFEIKLIYYAVVASIIRYNGEQELL